jgi:hypothetical protein
MDGLDPADQGVSNWTWRAASIIVFSYEHHPQRRKKGQIFYFTSYFKAMCQFICKGFVNIHGDVCKFASGGKERL